jgi:HAD superfamily hydrolase (TIGR01450 family)
MQGKQVRVLTNGASFPATRTRAKYLHWGLQFDEREVVSSRDALARALACQQDKCWGFAALEQSELIELVPHSVLLQDKASAYAQCDAFVLLGTGAWSIERHRLLAAALAKKPRPVLVGNPDLVAPHAAGLSREPGLYAHALQDEGVVTPEFYGKPFDNAFAILRETLQGVDPQRIAMVGDTLHTDILGGAQAGWRTVLVTDHGLLKGLDVEGAIRRSGIRPDFIVPTT